MATPYPPSLSPVPNATRPRTFLKVAVAIAALIALASFWLYGLDSNHANRDSMWWSERARSLTPPTATDITLQRDLLDHFATYTVNERDLVAFLDARFSYGSTKVDALRERRPVDAKLVGQAVGRLGWIATKDSVVYDFAASNGGVSTYYHDPTTGSTYQSSAHW